MVKHAAQGNTQNNERSKEKHAKRKGGQTRAVGRVIPDKLQHTNTFIPPGIFKYADWERKKKYDTVFYGDRKHCSYFLVDKVSDVLVLESPGAL